MLLVYRKHCSKSGSVCILTLLTSDGGDLLACLYILPEVRRENTTRYAGKLAFSS